LGVPTVSALHVFSPLLASTKAIDAASISKTSSLRRIAGSIPCRRGFLGHFGKSPKSPWSFAEKITDGEEFPVAEDHGMLYLATGLMKSLSFSSTG